METRMVNILFVPGLFWYYERIIYFSNNTATPNISLGSILNSPTAILEQNSTVLMDANTSTESSEFDITTSVVPTKIGKVQPIQF